MELGIELYSNDETADYIETVYGEKIIGRPERIPFEVGSFTITPFYVPHTTKEKETGALIPCPNFGYLVEHEEMRKLLYMTDFEYSPFSFKEQRINHMLIECNYIEDMVDRQQENYSHRLQGHCSLDTCKGIIEANKTSALRTVTLCHLSDSAAEPDRILNEVQKVAGKCVKTAIARAGMEPVSLNLCPF